MAKKNNDYQDFPSLPSSENFEQFTGQATGALPSAEELQKGMTPKEKKAALDRLRRRKNYDAPTQEWDWVMTNLADKLGTTESQVIFYLAAVGLQHLDLDDLLDARERGRSMRYAFNLKTQEVPYRWRGYIFLPKPRDVSK